jgi:hypothetical protein
MPGRVVRATAGVQAAVPQSWLVAACRLRYLHPSVLAPLQVTPPSAINGSNRPSLLSVRATMIRYINIAVPHTKPVFVAAVFLPLFVARPTYSVYSATSAMCITN